MRKFLTFSFFMLSIQRECFISREQKSSIGEIENRARNKDVNLRSSTAEGMGGRGQKINQLKGWILNKQTNGKKKRTKKYN